MSVYEPASDGLPAYFLPMLDDRDRNVKYELAIQRTIEQFRAEQGRAPRVVDLGCGTGMLSVFALRHGAAHVVALDLNKHMCELCKRTLSAEGFSKKQYQVVCGTVKKGNTRTSYTPSEPFDLLVSEILGTLATSEGIYEHTQNVLPHLRSFDFPAAGAAGAGGGGGRGDSGARGRRVYVIPAAITVTAAVYRFDALYGSSSAEQPMRQALEAIMPVPGGTGEVALMSSQNVSFGLHLLEVVMREGKRKPHNTMRRVHAHSRSS